MPMRITCPNCGKQFSAWDDLVGKAVECPKCHQKTVIAGPNEALGPVKPQSSQPSSSKPPGAKHGAAMPGGPKPASGSPSRQTPPNPPLSPLAPPPRELPPQPQRRVAPVSRPPATSGPAASTSGPTTATGGRTVPPPSRTAPGTPSGTQTFDDDESLPMGCPNCNASMAPNDDLCDSCGYHLVLKKVIDISEMPKRKKSVGFERFLEDQLHDPESSSSTLLWAKILASLVLLVVLTLCLGRWWWIGVLLVFGVGGWWWLSQRQKRGEDSTVNQDPISLVVWSALLKVQRILGWRRLTWPFSKTRCLILCDPQFDDRELSELDGLADFETLDLEGTGISDRGVDHLIGLKQLRFIVLRRTQVTAQGAQRLQQKLPKTLIWV